MGTLATLQKAQPPGMGQGEPDGDFGQHGQEWQPKSFVHSREETTIPCGS